MSNKIHNFDYLRIVAAICIVLHHYQQVFSVKFEHGLNFYGGHIPFGYIVELFFMLSGFLCFQSRKSKNFMSNILRKVLRVFPYAFFATLCYALVFLLYKAISGTDFMGKSFTVPNYICSLLLVHQGYVIEFSPAVNNPTWYLCVLIILYVLFYLIELVTASLPHQDKVKVCLYSGFVILGIIGWKCQWDAPFLHLTNFRGYSAFFVGVLINYMIRILNSKKKCIIIGCFLLALFSCYTIVTWKISWYACVLAGFPSIIILLSCVKQLPENKFATLLGSSSFEVYIWHAPLFYVIELIATICGISLSHGYVEMLVTLLLVEVVAIIMFKCVEKPLGTMLNKKLFSNGKNLKTQNYNVSQ